MNMSMLPSQDMRLGLSNLFLNPTPYEEWDIVVDDHGQLVTITEKEYISQKVQQLLRTCKGEVPVNVEYGVPYLTDILGIKNPDLTIIRQIFIDTIMNNTTLIRLGVTAVDIEAITLDDDRHLTIDGLTVSTIYNDIKIGAITL